MLITFLVPPSLDGALPAERSAGCTRLVYPMPNIYELTVAACLEKLGVEVRCRDFVLSNGTESELTDFLGSDKSDIYMIWTVNLSLETDLKVVGMIRTLSPEAKIVLMGPGVTYYTSKLLIDGNTIVVRGEPELTTVEVVDSIMNGRPLTNVKGISFLSEGIVRHNPSRPLIDNLDSLPFPARHLSGGYNYSNPKLKKQPYTIVVTSRNCPFHCIYCVPSSLTFAREIEHRKDNGRKPPVMMRSVENVIQEIDMLASQGYRAITFIDDNFITTARRLRPIAEAMKRHSIVWGCQARVDAITEEVASILGNSGCQFVDLGVESFNDDILKYIKKGITSEQIFKGIGLLKQHNVPVKLNILIGTSPLETVETVRDTFRKARSLGVSQVMFNIVAPFPGTEFYDIARSNGWIVGGDYKPTDVQRNSILSYPQLTSDQMEKLLFENNLRFFLRPSFIMMHITKFGSMSDFTTALKALKRKLFH